MRRAVAGLGLVLALGSSPALGPAAHATEDVGSTRAPVLPLDGTVVVVDPGHQLGNARFPRKTSRLVPAGGFRKPCNTTGSATPAGVAEATVVWRAARALERRLEDRGARVVLTRTTNSRRDWGPCVDERGRRGNRIDADLKISLHGDGAGPSDRGFHVIAPARRPRWTGDIWKPSRRLARDVRAALEARRFEPADYVAGGDGLDVRGDLGTLNLSDVPSVLVELGNLRNRRDARALTSDRGRQRVSRAMVAAVRDFLG